jgi:hypothetical protein
LSLLKWKIYFADGSTFKNTEGEIQDIPSRGVVGIVNIDTVTGWTLQSKRNYYVLIEGEEWWAVDHEGMILYLGDNLGSAAVLLGQLVSQKTWLKFFDRIKRDPELPNKSANRPEEIRA